MQVAYWQCDCTEVPREHESGAAAMRLLKRCFVPAALTVLFVNLGFSQDAYRSISGRLISKNGGFSCDRCLVTLLASGVRTVAAQYADFAGHFTFSNVPSASSYTILVQSEDFEDGNEEVDVTNGFGFETE